MNDFLPNLFILGAAKCGTSTVHTYLNNMPEICMSDPKEPIFFECEYEKGLDHYRKTYFSHWHGESIIGESRHRNLYLPYVPERIYKTNPEAKLVIILRNPIERAFSHWQHWYSRGIEKLSFSDAIMEDYNRINNGLRMETHEEQAKYRDSLYMDDKRTGYGIYRTYLDSGYYYDQIKRYANLFPSNNLLVILFAVLIQKPPEFISTLISFLGFDPHSYRVSKIQHVNIGYSKLYQNIIDLSAKFRLDGVMPNGIRQLVKNIIKRIEPKYRMDPIIRNWLYDHYYEHNRALEKLITLDLSHWK